MPNDRSNPVMFVRQAAEFDHALERNGCGADFVKWLSTGGTLASIREVYLGHAEVKPLEPIIDLNADPFVPAGWSVVHHQQGGPFKWDPKAVELYLSEPQRKDKSIKGYNLRKELEHKPTLNANLLDYLLAHQNLIPDAWREDEEKRIRRIFFWGTIYRTSGGDLFVRYLYWDGGRWNWNAEWLDRDWYIDSPALLRAS